MFVGLLKHPKSRLESEQHPGQGTLESWPFGILVLSCGLLLLKWGGTVTCKVTGEGCCGKGLEDEVPCTCFTAKRSIWNDSMKYQGICLRAATIPSSSTQQKPNCCFSKQQFGYCSCVVTVVAWLSLRSTQVQCKFSQTWPPTTTTAFFQLPWEG